MLSLDTKKMKVAAMVGNIVMTKAIIVIAGFWGGYKLDNKFKTKPLCTLLLGFTAIGLGIWYLLLMMKRVQSFSESNGDNNE